MIYCKTNFAFSSELIQMLPVGNFSDHAKDVWCYRC